MNRCKLFFIQRVWLYTLFYWGRLYTAIISNIFRASRLCSSPLIPAIFRSFQTSALCSSPCLLSAFALCFIFIAGQAHASPLKQAHLTLHGLQLPWLKQPDHAIFSVKAGKTPYPSLPQPPDSLPDLIAALTLNPFFRQLSQNRKLRPQLCQHFLILPHDPCTGSRTARTGADYFGKRHQALIRRCPRTHKSLLAVCKLCNPVRNA